VIKSSAVPIAALAEMGFDEMADTGNMPNRIDRRLITLRGNVTVLVPSGKSSSR
jgi:hypothetical protein